MTILLAPMEGLLDFTLRDILTRAGGIDRCVSEFIRVTGTLLPERVFYRVVPELYNGGCTPAGVPVRGQLMGSDAVCLAENAGRLGELGSTGVDLNFGCPAKVVNRHGGGAALLADPDLLHRIVGAVRRAVPAAVPVSAKMRLGIDDSSRAIECALAIQEAGADELVVHGRTKADGYRPPARWHCIGEIRAAVRVPVVANGEIWNVADAEACRRESGCDDLMLGRGMVAYPGLARAIADPSQPPLAWAALMPLMASFWQLVCAKIEPRAQAGRLKQWLNYLRRHYPEAGEAYLRLRAINDPATLALGLFGSTPDLHYAHQSATATWRGETP